MTSYQCDGPFCKGKMLPENRFAKKKSNKKGYMAICKMCYYNKNNENFKPGICEYCKKSHDCVYGSGRFCNATCRSFYSKNIQVSKSGGIVIVIDNEKWKKCIKDNCIFSGKEQSITNFYYVTRYTKNGSRKVRRNTCKSCAIKSVNKYKSSDKGFVKQLLNAAKTRSNRCNRVFLISEEDISCLFSKQKNKCVISGMNMTKICGGDKNSAKHPFNASLDRIDSSKGYEKNNIQLVCNWVQTAKSDYNQDEFKKWIIQTAKYITE